MYNCAPAPSHSISSCSQAFLGFSLLIFVCFHYSVRLLFPRKNGFEEKQDELQLISQLTMYRWELWHKQATFRTKRALQKCLVWSYAWHQSKVHGNKDKSRLATFYDIFCFAFDVLKIWRTKTKLCRCFGPFVCHFASSPPEWRHSFRKSICAFLLLSRSQ